METQKTTTKPPTPENELPSGGESGAMSCSACLGCQHRNHPEGSNWCYMFETAPDQLPCSQHDKFEPERQIMGAMIKKNPAILTMMVMTADEQNAHVEGRPEPDNSTTK